MHRRKRGTVQSGSGRRVKSRKQAIAIGLSEARKKGATSDTEVVAPFVALLKGPLLEVII